MNDEWTENAGGVFGGMVANAAEMRCGRREEMPDGLGTGKNIWYV